jgi:hypothetical protein
MVVNAFCCGAVSDSALVISVLHSSGSLRRKYENFFLLLLLLPSYRKRVTAFSVRPPFSDHDFRQVRQWQFVSQRDTISQRPLHPSVKHHGTAAIFLLIASQLSQPPKLFPDVFLELRSSRFTIQTEFLRRSIGEFVHDAACVFACAAHLARHDFDFAGVTDKDGASKSQFERA